jgi:hypothetical protein
VKEDLKEEQILIADMCVSGDYLLIPLSRKITTLNSRKADAILLKKTTLCGPDGRATYMFIGLTTKELAGTGTEDIIAALNADEQVEAKIRRILQSCLEKVGVAFSTMKYFYDPDQTVADLMQIRRGTPIGEGVSSLETKRPDGTSIIVLSRAAVVSSRGEDLSELRVVMGAYAKPTPSGGRQLLKPIRLSTAERALIDRRLRPVVWSQKPPALEARILR